MKTNVYGPVVLFAVGLIIAIGCVCAPFVMVIELSPVWFVVITASLIAAPVFAASAWASWLEQRLTVTGATAALAQLRCWYERLAACVVIIHALSFCVTAAYWVL